MDLLKENIQMTLSICRENIESFHSIYDKVFQHEHPGTVAIDFFERTDIKAFFIFQRRRFYQIINAQRTLVDNASIEPFNHGFSQTRYKILIQQQTDVYRMLYNINAAVTDGLFLPDLHEQLVDLYRQLNDCLNLWSVYFSLTQTKCFQLIRGSFHHRKHLIKSDLFKYEQCLIELNRTVVRLQFQHQEIINRVLKHYLSRFINGETTSTFVPYAADDQTDSIFIAISSMYYSTTQLAEAALDLGRTIYTLFEIQTTHLYRPF